MDLSNIQKTKTLLRAGCTVNDKVCAMYHQIYFVHQRIAELRNEGWVIDNIYDTHHKLLTYKLISEPAPIIPSNEFENAQA